MGITIKLTTPSEAEELSQIQKAAFKPLYDKYHDARNPFLRGPEDVLCRLNKLYRHFTILFDGKIVGGIFYRLHGKWSPVDELGFGEYYLGRLYIHPDFQNKGIARNAILLCEKEFPDAAAYYVDFPDDLEKNRRCYQNAGYRDTGRKICEEGAPTLALFKKTVNEASKSVDVSLPMIYEAEAKELPECLSVIRKSFETVAAEFGLTKENCPKHTSFMPLLTLKHSFHGAGICTGCTPEKRSSDICRSQRKATVPLSFTISPYCRSIGIAALGRCCLTLPQKPSNLSAAQKSRSVSSMSTML